MRNLLIYVRHIMPELPKDLRVYREHIDAIDDELLVLLKKRTALVEQVGAFKANQPSAHQSFIRAAREAMMLRRLIDNTDGPFPKHAVAALWRQIITTSLMLEHPFSVFLYLPPHADTHHLTFYRQTLGYFPSVTIHPYSCLTQLLATISSTPLNESVIVLPWKAVIEEWPWREMPSPTFKAFAAIPFLQENSVSPSLIAFADIPSEPTGHDQTLVFLESSKPFSILSPLLAFAGEKWPAYQFHASSYRDRTGYLITVPTYIDEDDATYQAFTHIALQLDPKAYHRIIGHFATPVSFE